MPEWTLEIARRLSRPNHHPDPGVVEELGQHAAAAYEAARAEGLDPAAATARVEALLREWTAAGAALHHRSRLAPTIEPPPSTTSSLAGLLHDLRYACRLAFRKPGPTVIAALTMALGIGATASLFNVTWTVLMKPLPWTEPDTLIRLRESREGATRSYPGVFTNGSYLALADQPQTLEALAGYSAGTVTLTGAGDPQRVRVVNTTATLFNVMRAVPVRGAFFSVADEAAGTSAVISHAFWQRQYGGSDDVIGKPITFDGRTLTIAGVMSPDFVFPDAETVAWVPLQVRPSRSADGGSYLQMLTAVARLEPGVTPAQAAEEATARARSAPDPGLAIVAVFGSKGAPVIGAERLLDAATGDVRQALWVLLAAVALLLVTATANIASVQLARAASRRRELAIRLSLGASSGRIAGQLVLESLVIGMLGALGGIALALLIHITLPAVLPPDFPRVREITFDWRIVGVAIAASLLSSLTFGLIPALQARRLAPKSGLAEDAGAVGTSFSRSSTARLRAGIMVAQVTVACLLLVGASLFARTFVAMLHEDRGYDANNVLSARIASPEGLFTDARRTAMVDRVLERLRAHPDVISAGAANNLPLLPGESMMALTLPAGPGRPEDRQVQTGFRLVTPGYLEAMGITVTEGRAFTDRDTASAQPVVIVNRVFADRYLQETPVGSRLPLTFYEGRTDWELVGIVDNVRMRASLADPPGPELFIVHPQSPGFGSAPIIVVRTRTAPTGMMETLRQVVSMEEPTAAIESMMTMEDRLAGSLSRPRLYAFVLVAFAVFAVTIAAVGLFGVLSYSVAQRSKELGVRAALGARPGQIVGMVLREGFVISGLGIAAGLVLAAIASRGLASFLYGVSPVDVISYLGVTVILLAIAALAVALPARRAARVDPLIVLKSS